MRPFSLLVKPAGPSCNLVCRHCFYSSRSELFGAGPLRMSDDVLEKLIRDYLSLGLEVSSFCWQGGEPTQMGLDFFKRVIELQKKYAGTGQAVSNSLQTNATLLDDQWCSFLKEYDFLVGISLDGPRHLHDHYRVDPKGKGSWDRAMAGIEACRKNGAEFNILTLLTDHNAGSWKEIFDFYVENKFDFVQLIPCIEIDNGRIADYSISAADYGTFLCGFFDLWLTRGPEKMSVRLFDSVMNCHIHGRHTICCFNRRCDDYVVVEHNGDVYACDFFVEPRWKIGSMLDEPISDLARSKPKAEFSELKTHVAQTCFVCRHFNICRGACPKERLARGDHKAPSIYCESYKKFFDHASAALQRLAFEAVNGRK